MEMIQSLIHKLYRQAEAKVSVADLYATTGLLYSAFEKYNEATPIVQKEAISIWLPIGFGVKNDVPESQELPKDTQSNQAFSAVSAIAPPILPPQVPIPTTVAVAPAEALPVEEKKLSSPLPPHYEPAPAPVQPAVLFTEKEWNAPIEYQLDVVPTEEEIDEAIAAEKLLQLEAEARHQQELAEKITLKLQDATPVAPTVTTPLPNAKPFPHLAAAELSIAHILPPVPVAEPVKKELNEWVAKSTTSLHENLPARGKELADVLTTTGPKISDIRKAIGINQKYQMISGLFRGDEDAFERSIRTLNNFGSLPEARFWMQRELVVKLGWKDDDHLVQEFQLLLNRRFS